MRRQGHHHRGQSAQDPSEGVGGLAIHTVADIARGQGADHGDDAAESAGYQGDLVRARMPIASHHRPEVPGRSGAHRQDTDEDREQADPAGGQAQDIATRFLEAGQVAPGLPDARGIGQAQGHEDTGQREHGHGHAGAPGKAGVGDEQKAQSSAQARSSKIAGLAPAAGATLVLVVGPERHEPFGSHGGDGTGQAENEGHGVQQRHAPGIQRSEGHDQEGEGGDPHADRVPLARRQRGVDQGRPKHLPGVRQQVHRQEHSQRRDADAPLVQLVGEGHRAEPGGGPEGQVEDQEGDRVRQLARFAHRGLPGSGGETAALAEPRQWRGLVRPLSAAPACGCRRAPGSGS